MGVRGGASSLTLMLIDPEPGSHRQLLKLLSIRGHRVVPVALEEAADLSKRFRFDAVLWANHPESSRWSEFQEHIRHHISAFVLLSDSKDPELARSVKERGGFLLGHPIQESELDNILQKLNRPHCAANCRST